MFTISTVHQTRAGRGGGRVPKGVGHEGHSEGGPGRIRGIL